MANYHSMLMQLSKTMWYKSAITSDIYFFVVSEQWQYIWWHILTTCYEYIVVACWLFYVNETAWELYQCADSKAVINLIVQKDKWSFVWGFKVLFRVATQWNFGSFGEISKISFILKFWLKQVFDESQKFSNTDALQFHPYSSQTQILKAW